MSSYARFEEGKLVELLDSAEVLSADEGWKEVPFYLTPFIDLNYVQDEEGRIAPPTPAYLEKQLFAKLADLRWKKQQLGIKFDGVLFQSDDVSVERLRSKALSTETFAWKTADGFVELTGEKAATVYNSLIVARDHLFWYESDVQAQIKDATAYTDKTDDGVEVDATWYESKIYTWFRLSESELWDVYNPFKYDFKDSLPEQVEIPVAQQVVDLDARYRAHLSAARYDNQCAGVTVDGVVYRSAPEDVNSMSSTIALGREYEAAEGPGTWKTPWKAKSGFVDHTLASLTQVALLIGGYTQACFEVEREKLNDYLALLQGDESDDDKLDTIKLCLDSLKDGWPVREFTTPANTAE